MEGLGIGPFEFDEFGVRADRRRSRTLTPKWSNLKGRRPKLTTRNPKP